MKAQHDRRGQALVLGVALSLSLACTTPALAGDETLLGAVAWNFWFPYCAPYPSLDEAAPRLQYDNPPPVVDFTPIALEDGETGTYDFYADTPGFAEVVDRLTNCDNEGLTVGVCVLNAYCNGSAGVGLSECVWGLGDCGGPNPDLGRHHIEFIRLNVLQVDFEPYGGGYDGQLTISLSWEFYGHATGDLTCDGQVTTEDLLCLLQEWGPCCAGRSPSELVAPGPGCPPHSWCHADLDDDCEVGVTDLLTLLANWG